MSKNVLHTIPVDLAARSYPVLCGPGALGAAMTRLKALCPNKRLICVSDETVAAHHLQTLQSACEGAGITLHPILIPPGEAQKSFARLESLCADLLALEVERGEAIAAFGGGVVGDLTGFASSILKRGTHFIQIPTTLLAQVDSSVGGKTAINMPAGKNLIGAFHQPDLVIADSTFLRTLPARQMRAGYAEIAKCAALGDVSFFGWLEANGPAALQGDAALMAEAIARSVAGKAGIVARDEREHGERALLNLGHSFGHALESLAGYEGALVHGEAVAAGMSIAFAYGVHLGLCPQDDQVRLTHHLATCGLPTGLRTAPGGPYRAADMMPILMNDKKNSGGQLRLVLPRALGDAFVYQESDLAGLERFLHAQAEQK
jgi:3-dehydroquinate synthase